MLQAIADPTGSSTRGRSARRLPPADCSPAGRRVGRARRPLLAVPEGQKIPWFGPPMSPTSMATARFMETWAHGLDVAEALGLEPNPPTASKHVAHLGVRTRDFAFAMHGLERSGRGVPGGAIAPSGETWDWGPEDAAQRVTGSAYDFCLLVTQRATATTSTCTPTAPTPTSWLDIAQAFAGPPGRAAIPRADDNDPRRQLLRLLRRPALGDARDARGRSARLPHRRLPRRADDVDPRHGPVKDPSLGYAHVRQAGRGQPRPGPRERGQDRRQRRRPQPRRAGRDAARGRPGLGSNRVAHVEGDDLRRSRSASTTMR